LSAAFGFVSSFFGIGGGFLYVPALIYLLKFPIHKATATSLFILTRSAFCGSVTHIMTGAFSPGRPTGNRGIHRRNHQRADGC